VIAMFHPAAALHQASLKPAILADFAKLPQLLDQARKGLGRTAAGAKPAQEDRAEDPKQLNCSDEPVRDRGRRGVRPGHSGRGPAPRRNDVNQRRLLARLEDKSAKIAVLGMGYVGLPLAVVFAEAGFEVQGIDPDQSKRESLDRDVSYIQDVPSSTIKRLRAQGKLSITTDFSALRRRMRSDLRTHATAQDRRPGHVLYPFGRGSTCPLRATRKW